MKRLSLVCEHCHSKDFEVTYGSGSCDGSWQVELVCQSCGHITLIAVTKNYVPGIDCVNEPRDFYYPQRKSEGGEVHGRSREEAAGVS